MIDVIQNKCMVCGFELYIPVYYLKSTNLGLYDDNRFPGRCLLVYKSHVEHFDLLKPNETLDFVTDIQIASKALKIALNVERINVAILGNAESHLHAHLIPRVPNNEPIPNKAPWAHPDDVAKLYDEQRFDIINKITKEMNKLNRIEY